MCWVFVGMVQVGVQTADLASALQYNPWELVSIKGHFYCRSKGITVT